MVATYIASFNLLLHGVRHSHKKKTEMSKIYYAYFLTSCIVYYTSQTKSANVSTHSYMFIKKKYYTFLFQLRKHFISPTLLFPVGEKKNAANANQIVSTSIL